ncbi:hypothetical protein RIF29_41217 [Crotalaria pallida]|uniref:Oligopeptide transporter n=1 Tax=Crotalaria pallida TaxID=3830 RepID=A0AAN9E554_CROPI
MQARVIHNTSSEWHQIKEATEKAREITCSEGDEIGEMMLVRIQVRCCTDENDKIDDNPIEQVRLTISIVDDPKQLVLTFRAWTLGLSSCVLLAFVNEFFGFRINPLYVSSVAAQIVTLPFGKLMAATLPTNKFNVPLTKWSFTLNPRPFSMKEHALITILAGTGSSGVYAINIITIVKALICDYYCLP